MIASTNILNKRVATKQKRIGDGLLLAFAIIFGLLFFLNNPLLNIFVLFVIFAFAFFDKYLSLAVFIITTILTPDFSTAELFAYMFEVSVVGISIMMENHTKGISRLFIVDLAFFVIMMLGMAFGSNSKMVSILLYTFTLFASAFIAQSIVNGRDNLVMKALLYGCITMALITLYQYLTGRVDILSTQGRLTFEEHAKTLSTAIVIPIFMAINVFFKLKQVKISDLILYGIIFLLCLPLFLLTYSRGVTVALILATLLLYFIRSKNTGFIGILIAIVIGVVVYQVSTRLEMDSSLWFDNIEGGNGRTDIWQQYYNYMHSKGSVTIWWGLGSSDLKNVLGWNPHSVLFSNFFSFGIFGVMFILFQTVTPLYRLFSNRKELGFFFCLLVLTITMFSSHGGYGESLFWIIIGISFGFAYKKKNNIRI